MCCYLLPSLSFMIFSFQFSSYSTFPWSFVGQPVVLAMVFLVLCSLLVYLALFLLITRRVPVEREIINVYDVFEI